MKVEFVKMHGCGNDYVFVDCREKMLEDPCAAAKKIADRRFGVGGDGLVLITASDVADAGMRMFNADGSEGKMCGNAIRCVGKYLYDNGINKKTLTIETLSGIKDLELKIAHGVAIGARVDMGAPILDSEKIPVKGRGTLIGVPFIKYGLDLKMTCVSMGNPHAVFFVDDVKNFAVEQYGPLIEHDDMFPERVNAEFVKVVSADELEMRVWERGSGETFACGTGACASTVAAVLNGYAKRGKDVNVRLQGGTLIVNYGDSVTMTGEAVYVFKGETEI